MTREKRADNNPEILYCEERQRLTVAVLAAIHELTDLQAQQTKAIIEGDREFPRFDDLIHMARRVKDEAKYALMAHIDQHGC